MIIGGREFNRVAILVLDYDPYREDKPSEAVIKVYDELIRLLERKYTVPSGPGINAEVLANEELVAKHQKDFESHGLTFFPDWREAKSGYRELLREGLRQGTDIYVMEDIGNKGGYGVWYMAKYALVNVTKDGIEITDPEGKIDIKPKGYSM